MQEKHFSIEKLVFEEIQSTERKQNACGTILCVRVLVLVLVCVRDRQLKYNSTIYQWGVDGPAAFPECCSDTMACHHRHIPACTLFLFSRSFRLMLC